jgi:hypothetical protein
MRIQKQCRRTFAWAPTTLPELSLRGNRRSLLCDTDQVAKTLGLNVAVAIPQVDNSMTPEARRRVKDLHHRLQASAGWPRTPCRTWI